MKIISQETNSKGTDLKFTTGMPQKGVSFHWIEEMGNLLSRNCFNLSMVPFHKIESECSVTPIHIWIKYHCI